MSIFLRAFSLSLIVICTMLGVAHAQERSVGGPLQTEASWSALKNLVEATHSRVSVLQVDIDAAKNCAAQTKLWDPKRGCVAISSDKKGCTWKSSMCPYTSGCHIRTRNALNQVVFQDVPTKWEHGDVYVYRLGNTDNYYASQCRNGSLTGYYTAQ